MAKKEQSKVIKHIALLIFTTSLLIQSVAKLVEALSKLI